MKKRTAPDRKTKSRGLRHETGRIAKASPKTIEKKAGAAIASMFYRGLHGVLVRLSDALSVSPTDTVSAIKADHEALRKFLGVLKDTRASTSDRRHAYTSFVALLRSHSTSEERAVYRRAEAMVGREMRVKVAEGYVEHRLADDLMKRIASTRDTNAWSAQVNVLAEVVEHHLREEERALLPRIREKVSSKGDAEMLEEFLSLRAKSQHSVTAKNGGVLETAKAAEVAHAP